MRKFFAGIGSRNTPPEILKMMEEISIMLDKRGFTLRSGGAVGADAAFARGTKKAQIWIPWEGFGCDLDSSHDIKVIDENDEDAFQSVDNYHPNGKKLKKYVRFLMARNFRQIIGLNEPNSKFVICWTPDGSEDGRGKKSGGTGQALEIAKDFEIPIYNLGNDFTRADFHRELKLFNYGQGTTTLDIYD